MAGYNLNFPTVASADNEESPQQSAKFSYKDILTSTPISLLPNNLEPTFNNPVINQKTLSPQKTSETSKASLKQVVSDIPIVEKKKNKKFTLADHIGEEISRKINFSSSNTNSHEKSTVSKQATKTTKKEIPKDDNTKKSLSKMNRVEKAFLSKGDMKGMKPIRLEIRSEDASKITNEDVYNAFIKAVTHSTNEESTEALVTVLTKKKKPNKLKKLILKEKEIRKLHNIAPGEFLDVKKFLKNLKEDTETESVVIEIVPEKTEETTILENSKTILTKEDDSSDGEEKLVADDEMDILSIAESMEVVLKNSNERKIREYVNYPLDPDYENIIFQMLTKLQFYQFRLKKTDKKKFKQRLRYVIGIREVLKGLKLKHIRAVVIAPNIDKVTTPGGLDTKIEEIIQKCNEQELPVFFALTKKKLGTAMKTSTKISLVGLYSMDGAFDEFKKAKQIVEEKLLAIEKQKKEQNRSGSVCTEQPGNVDLKN
ncbi:predicted protein [Naegleria gruberi]|uniref:Predicted protein n=1 Tax=Naegleria gruberi TaxID=5762 RepID=D2UYB4_NAEGR|nr:uncharacterized protein NAEGRDRAFT_45136 [Naegleria gruberi]EFC50445.1 predicted protein [Naegleria gruberi]|eukprot:XP_002683189.1 predicted protein [Naegleria gruberi strain NEG-M]